MFHVFEDRQLLLEGFLSKKKRKLTPPKPRPKVSLLEDDWDGARRTPIRPIMWGKKPADEPEKLVVDIRADKFGDQVRFKITYDDWSTKTIWWNIDTENSFFIRGI